MSVEYLRRRPHTMREWVMFVFWTNPIYVAMLVPLVGLHIVKGPYVSKYIIPFLIGYAALVFMNWKRARPR